MSATSGSLSYKYNSASNSNPQFNNHNFITNEFLNSFPGPSQREAVSAPVNVSTWSSNNEMDDLTREELGYDPAILVGDVLMGSTDASFKTDGLGPWTTKMMKREVGSPNILRKLKTDEIKKEIKEENVEDQIIPTDEIKQEIIKQELEDIRSEYEEEDSNDRHNVSLLAHWLKLCSIKMN